MTHALKTLLEVRELIGQLPSTSVEEYSLEGQDAKIVVYVASHRSLWALQRACQGANVGITPWVRYKIPDDGEIQPAAVCKISANTAHFETIHSGYLQLLGVHLIWYLHKVGLLEKADANDRLSRWNAVKV
jgi:hypothetical protein